jgi:hypothetical protein
MGPPDSCPPPERLESLVRGRLPALESAALAGHLERCPRCSDAAANIAGAIAEESRGPRERRLGASAPRAAPWPVIVALGAGAGLAIFLSARGGREPAVREVPSPAAAETTLSVRAFARTRGDIQEVAGRVPLAAGDRIRLAVDAPFRGFLLVVSVGPTGAVEVLHPPGATTSRAFGDEPRQFLMAIPVSPAPSPERIFTLFTREPLDLGVVRDAAARALRASDVRALRRLPIEPARQWTLLVEKR